MLRRQLPAYSPLSLGALASSALGAARDAHGGLRSRLTGRFGSAGVVLCGSGTQALTLALRSSGRGGLPPLVALPAYACFDLISALVGAGARAVFYDVDPATLQPDFETLAEACRAGPDAVVVAPLYGIPIDWTRVEEVVRPCGATLVEDAAQGVGASWQGKPHGALGDLTVLSFGRGKGWTGGGGGALLIRSKESVEEPTGDPGPGIGVAIRTAAVWALGRPGLYWLPASVPFLALGETRYHSPREPHPMSRTSAALALATEEASFAEVAVRRHHAELLQRLLASEAPVAAVVPLPAGGDGGYLRLPVIVAGGLTGLEDPGRAVRRGVMPGYPTPLPDLEAVIGRSETGPPLPGARFLSENLVTLPTHSRLAEADLEGVVEALKGIEPRARGPARAPGA